VDEEAETGGARRLLARSRLPPIRWHAPSAPRYVLLCVGSLKQIPNAVFQQFDSPLQGADLSNPHYRDRHVQVKGWGTQHLNLVERSAHCDKACRQQPESISCLNEGQLQMHVVDFSRNHGGEAGTAHLIDEACP
jgi:hypothetical protein